MKKICLSLSKYFQNLIPVMKYAGIIFCFVLFLPYIITVFSQGMEEAVRFPALEGPIITITSEKGTEKIPTDVYLCEILAKYYGMDYTREELKAYCVILRTNLLYDLESDQIFFEDAWDYKMRREQWGNQFLVYETDLRNIISETKGEILLLDGTIQKITIGEFSGGQSDYKSLLYSNYADYVIYHSY